MEVRREGAVCVLTIRRPEKLNALSTAVERSLDRALSDDETRSSACVVLTGEGRAFSAGADVTEMGDLDPSAILAYYRESGEVYERVASLPQPTVAAVHGYCLGGGLELALAADFRIADRSAVFGFPEVPMGIVPSSGGTLRLARLVGPARAKELLLLRTRFGPEDALRFGLVTEVVEEGQAPRRALKVAGRLSTLPRDAVAVAKQAADLMPEASREAALLVERLAYGMLAQTAAHREATTHRGGERRENQGRA